MGIAQGRLLCGINDHGIYAYDGTDTFKVFSPGLLIKIFRLRHITVFTAGTWLMIYGWIVWFKSDRKSVARHFKINEDYQGGGK